jgi:hypothetical protein
MKIRTTDIISTRVMNGGRALGTEYLKISPAVKILKLITLREQGYKDGRGIFYKDLESWQKGLPESREIRDGTPHLRPQLTIFHSDGSISRKYFDTVKGAKDEEEYITSTNEKFIDMEDYI